MSFYSTTLNGQNATCFRTVKSLLGLPHWNLKEEPPLSIKEALDAARKRINKDFPEMEIVLDEIEIDSRWYSKDPKNKDAIVFVWYYKIEFDKLLKGGFKAKGPPSVVVLMDGSTVMPVVDNPKIGLQNK